MMLRFLFPGFVSIDDDNLFEHTEVGVDRIVAFSFGELRRCRSDSDDELSDRPRFIGRRARAPPELLDDLEALLSHFR